MRDIVIDGLKRRFESYNDLLAGIEESDLNLKVDVPRHKSLTEHLWCIVGARESYASAIAAGEWQGFACSMTSYGLADFKAHLNASAAGVITAVTGVDDWSPARDDLLATLAEHEVMHEGGLIRHCFALELPIPDSVRWA